MESIAIDMLGPFLRTTSGNECIMVVVIILQNERNVLPCLISKHILWQTL